MTGFNLIHITTSGYFRK